LHDTFKEVAVQRRHDRGTQFPSLPANFQSAPSGGAKNGTAWKVKIPEEYLAALRSIAKRIGESDLAPQPTTHSLILKAISNYIQLCKESKPKSKQEGLAHGILARP